MVWSEALSRLPSARVWLSLAVLILLLLFLFGCKDFVAVGVDNGAVGNKKIVPAPELFLVDEDPDVSLAVRDSTSLILRYSGGPPDIEVGSIIGGRDAGVGYLRSVTSIGRRDSLLVLGTEYAAVADAIEEGRIDTTLEFRLEDFRRKPDTPSTVRLDLDRRTIDVSGTIYSGEVSGVDVYVGIAEGSEISFEPDLDFVLDVGFANLVDELIIAAKGDLGFDVTAEASLSGEVTYADSILVAGFSTPPAPVWGPVTVSLHIDLILGFRAGVECLTHVESRCEGTYSLRFGAHYLAHEGWGGIWERDASFTQHDPEWSAGCEYGLVAFVRPKISLVVCEVAGGFLAPEPYFRFAVEAEGRPTLCWELSAGVRAAVGLEAKVWKFELGSWSYAFAHQEWPILEDCREAPTGTIIVDVDPDGIGAGWELDGPWGYSHSGSGDETLTNMDVGDYQITWGDVSGYTTPSPNPETKTLAADTTVTFSGTYEEEGGFEPQDFDTMASGVFPEGWVLWSSGYGAEYQVVDTLQCVSFPNSFKMEGATASGASAWHDVPSACPYVVLEVDVYPTEVDPASWGNNIAGVSLVVPGVGEPVQLHFGPSYTGSTLLLPGYPPGPHYEQNEWHHVRIEASFASRTFDVWFDGERIWDDAVMDGDQWYSAVELQGGNSCHTRAWFDNVEVYEDTQCPVVPSTWTDIKLLYR